LLKNLKKTSAELIREKALGLLYSLLSTQLQWKWGEKGEQTYCRKWVLDKMPKIV
jgi:hypothetical protein